MYLSISAQEGHLDPTRAAAKKPCPESKTIFTASRLFEL
jgi:hypothetical protein